MIKVYTSPSCASCRKVKKYFNENSIEYVEKNIINTPLSREDIYNMIVNSENGFEDIISTRSKIFKDKGLDSENMTINELVDFIIENPTILRRPIIMTSNEIQVGYNDDDITLFLPPELRERECLNCFKGNNCDYVQSLIDNTGKKCK